MVFLDLREHWLRLLDNLRLLWFSLMYIISHHLWLRTLKEELRMEATRIFVARVLYLAISVLFIEIAGIFDHCFCC
jgi:hypothetical protein